VFVTSTTLCREITHQGIRSEGISCEGIAGCNRTRWSPSVIAYPSDVNLGGTCRAPSHTNGDEHTRSYYHEGSVVKPEPKLTGR